MESTKVCPRCRRPLPRTEFRFRGGVGSRRSLCSPCWSAYQRNRRANLRVRKVKSFVEAVSKSRGADATIRLVAEVSKRFGGPEGLAKEWHDCMEETRRRRPGSAALLRSWSAILKLGSLVYEPRATRQDRFAQWTEAQLEREIESYIDGVVDRAVASRAGLGDPEDATDPPAADPEDDPAEDAGPLDAGGCALAEELPPG